MIAPQDPFQTPSLPEDATLLRLPRRSVPATLQPAAVAGCGRTMRLRDGRTLGYDDFGAPAGVPIVFLHGFASSRLLRHPEDSIAADLGIRIIAPDRPGIGLSSRVARRRLLDWPADLEQLLDACGVGRFGILAWSGGGPYALAAGWVMPERVSVVGLVSSAAPLAGVRGANYLEPMHRVASRAGVYAPWMIRLAMWNLARQQRADPEAHLLAAIESMIEADQQILADPALRAVMIANVAELHRQGGKGLYDEALVMARRWGFPLENVNVPVRIWHGEADVTVPVDMGRYLSRVLPDCRATFYPGEGHHLMYDRWREILSALGREAEGGRSES